MKKSQMGSWSQEVTGFEKSGNSSELDRRPEEVGATT